MNLRDNGMDVVKPLTLSVNASEFDTHNETQKIYVGRMTITNATLWWPRQFGTPHLYDLQVGITELPSEIMDIKNVKVGIRKVRLNQLPMPNGQNFYFTVND